MSSITIYLANGQAIHGDAETSHLHESLNYCKQHGEFLAVCHTSGDRFLVNADYVVNVRETAIQSVQGANSSEHEVPQITKEEILKK